MQKPLKFLIIEDDSNICDLIKLYIEKLGYRTILSYNGEDGIEKYYDQSPDFIILDIMMPLMSGWEVCQEIRRDNKLIPIIMLTGRGESYDKIKGFDLGADDYVVKPFEPNELMARVKAILRRSFLSSEEKENIQIDDLTIDMNQYKIFHSNEEIIMPPKEIELLYFLAKHPNHVFTRQQLIDQLWGFDYEGDSRTIDVHVKRIREKIKENSSLWSLKTIRGVGYKFEVKSHV